MKTYKNGTRVLEVNDIVIIRNVIGPKNNRRMLTSPSTVVVVGENTITVRENLNLAGHPDLIFTGVLGTCSNPPTADYIGAALSIIGK